jgi:hypothetical protein
MSPKRRKKADEPLEFVFREDHDESVGPCLNWIRGGALNYPKGSYSAQTVQMLAGQLGGIIQPAPGTLGCTPFAGALAATVLRALASSPAALDELNVGQKAGVVERNRVVHYLVRLEILGNTKLKKSAKSDVAVMWNVTADSVKDDHTKHGDDARAIIEAIMVQAMTHPSFATRDKALAALNSDMSHRAKLMRNPKPRKKRRKKITKITA